MKTKHIDLHYLVRYLFLLTLTIFGVNTAVYAADGQIQFQGNILDDACTVDPNMGSPKTVVLGDVHKTAFSAVGSTAAPTRFSIVLTDCPSSVAGAAVKFDGPSDLINPDLLRLAVGSIATNVAVAIYESDSSTLIPIATASKDFTLDTDPGATNTLEFIAKYMATSTGVTAGSANATTDFTIVYN